MARVRMIAALLALLLLTPILSLPAHAAEDRQTQVVYNGQVFEGQGYIAQFYPANEGTIYLLADAQNVLAPRKTEVYWWQITQEWKADWEKLNEPLTGTLEIGDLSFPMTTVSLRYDGGYDSTKTTLLTSDAAVTGYADHKKAQADYQAGTARYNDLRAQYEDLLAVWGKAVSDRQAEGKPTDDLPVPKQPVAPSQPSFAVTEPAPGIPFTIPAGEYQMRLRGEDGQVIAGSERKVVAFAERREGIAYKVIAASKYTVPDASTDPNDTIFVSGEKALYVQPAAEREYDNYYAAELLNPQQRAAQDRRGFWAWMPSGTYSGAELKLSVNGAAPKAIKKVKYYAKQNPGAALGYEILPYDSSAGEGVSTFDAFQVTPQNGAMSISAPGVAGSSREIRVVQTSMGSLLLVLAFLPLVAGLVWLFFRRWSTR